MLFARGGEMGCLERTTLIVQLKPVGMHMACSGWEEMVVSDD
jgi:hypothetical protein